MLRGKKPNIVIVVLIVAAMLTLLFAVIESRKKKELPVYTTEQGVNVETDTEAPIQIDASVYLDEENHFQVQIPDGWTKAKTKQSIQFVHSASATSVTITSYPYISYINNMDETTMSTNVTNGGYQFVSWQKTSPSSYETIYQKLEKGTFDYIVETFWNRDRVVELTFVLDDNNYKKMSPYLDKIYNSFAWTEDANVIPEGYSLINIELGDFEFGIPTEWYVGVEGSVIVGNNADNTARMTVTVQEHNGDFTDVTSYDLSNMIRPGRENGFIINDFNTNTDKITVKAQYFDANGVNMESKSYLFTNKRYMYWIQFDYYSNAIDNSIPETCAELFREFMGEPEPEQTTEQKTEQKTKKKKTTEAVPSTQEVKEQPATEAKRDK